MFDFLSGKTKSETKVPAFVTKGGEFGVNRSMDIANTGYMPYMGPTVAALAPQQYAAMQNTQNGLSAFGMASPTSGGPGGMSNQGGVKAGTPGDTMGMYQPANVTDSEVDQGIAAAYMRNLGRSPDQAGMDFWREHYDPNTIDEWMSMGVQLDPLTGLPAAGNFNGIRGYSSYPVMKGAQQQLQTTYPGQYDAHMSMFIDPVTGGDYGGQAGGQMAANPLDDWMRILDQDPRYGRGK